MNFPQHVKGAALAGAVVGALALASGQADIDARAVEEFFRQPQKPNEARKLLSIIILTWFMGLFPDLDTGSTPRKHYFRWVFGLSLFLFILRDLQMLGFIAVFSMTPMLGKHRGWTHWIITPWVLALMLSVLLEYLRVREASWFTILLFGGFSMENVLEWLLKNWIYPAAFVIGHYMHLLLDSEWIKKVPVIGASKQPPKSKQSRKK